MSYVKVKTHLKKQKKNGSRFLMMMLFASFFCQNAQAETSNVQITSRLSHPYVTNMEEHTVYLKVGLKGEVIQTDKERPPINVALVLDKSGSMSGKKIQDVKDAAKMLVDRLKPSDTLSVIVYDNGAQVIIPAAPLIHPTTVKSQIDHITAGGGTALYDGVRTGVTELKRFISDNQVNRVILLSDGLANVGPSSPYELGQLGTLLINEGISVSTIGLGLGYNEDLMTRLAAASDGFHQFAEDTALLAQAFDWQFGKLKSIVANDTNVNIKFAKGVTPLRIFGRDGHIYGDTVNVKLNQIFSSHEVYVLVEAKIAPSITNSLFVNVAEVNVDYYDLGIKTAQKYRSKIIAQLTDDTDMVRHTRDQDVIIAATEQKAAGVHAEVIQLRDQGHTVQAEKKLNQLSKEVNQAAEDLNSDRLGRYGSILEEQLENIKDNLNWNKTRKQGTSTLHSVSFGTI